MCRIDEGFAKNRSEGKGRVGASGTGGQRGLISTVQAAFFCEREWIETFVAVEGVGLLGSFQPVDDGVGQGCCEHLVGYFENIAGDNHVAQRSQGDDTDEREEDDKSGIDGLTDDGGTDGAGPEPASVGEELEAGHGVRVGELTGPEGDEAGSEDARDEAEDDGKSFLVVPPRSGRKRNNYRAHDVEQDGAEEAQPDCSAGGCEAVDLCEDVAEDVGDRKQKNSATDGKRADLTDFLGNEIRDQQYDHESCGEDVEIFIPASVCEHGVLQVCRKPQSARIF